MLKYKTIKMIDVRDWDKLVSSTYGKIYSFQQQDGCQSRGVVNITIPDETYEDEMNDEIPEKINGEVMGIKFDKWLERDITQSVEGRTDWYISLFWERNFYPNIQTVANNLHEKGLIEAGDYTINIDW